MKSIVALSIVAGLSTLLVGSTVAAEMKAGQKGTATPNIWGETPTPHFRNTGKPISVKWGEQVFNDHCALCHGLEGKGDGPRSAFFQPGQQYIADLSNADFVNGRYLQLLTSIREGLQRFPEPSYVMPQFKYILSEEEIRSALAYIKTLPGKAKRH